jgi:hypothetical protein
MPGQGSSSRLYFASLRTVESESPWGRQSPGSGSDPQATIDRLRALANDRTTTEGERSAARRRVQHLIKKHGLPSTARQAASPPLRDRARPSIGAAGARVDLASVYLEGFNLAMSLGRAMVGA